MREVCTDFGATLGEFSGEDNHVHLLIDFPPTVQHSRLINSLKGVSSRLQRRDYNQHISRYLWGGHLWSSSYYVVTTGGTNLDAVKRYVQDQDRPK